MGTVAWPTRATVSCFTCLSEASLSREDICSVGNENRAVLN